MTIENEKTCMCEKFKNACLSRLKQSSTWGGIISLLAVLGVNISPDNLQIIISSAVGLISSVNILKDN